MTETFPPLFAFIFGFGAYAALDSLFTPKKQIELTPEQWRSFLMHVGRKHCRNPYGAVAQMGPPKEIKVTGLSWLK